MYKVTSYLILIAAVFAMAGCAMGTSGSMSNNAQHDLASRAASQLRRQMSFPPGRRIPKEYLTNARCIGVFPAVVKAGFIIGGRRGKGLVSCRQPGGGWNNAAPAVYTITGASIGLQAGATKSTIILLFMTNSSTDALRQGKFELGAGLAVTAGPVGFNADVGGAPSPVLAYVTSKTGLYAGVNLTGSRLSFSDSANTRLYGDDADAEDILFGSMSVPATVDTFVQTLTQYAPYPQH